MASLSGEFNFAAITDSGAPLAQGRLYTYVAGTTTKKTAYTDAAASVAHTYTSDGAGGEYIALNSRGELPSPLFLNGTYDITLKRSDGTTVWTRRARGDDSDTTTSILETSGIDKTGATDSTAGLITAFTAGGDLYVPEGDYLIADAGADTGGVYVTITKDTTITCHPNARFFTDGVDNDMIRFTVPSNGSGLPADGITFQWIGGVIDQRNQKNSTVVPFSAEYPPANQGTSATADGLSIRGDFTDGTVQFGITRAIVMGLTTIGADHWEDAGGDTGVFIGGCRMQETYYCRHVGARDLGFYSSGDLTGVLQSKCVAIGNKYEHCFGGVSQKRSSGDAQFIGNTFINNPRAMAVEHIIGSGTERVYIAGNTGTGCGILARVTYAFGGSIVDNHFTDSGALLADGVTAESAAGLEGWNLRGCKHIFVERNTAIGMVAAAAAAYPTTQRYLYTESYDPGGGAVATTYCTFKDNKCDGYRSLGADAGDSNSFIDNLALNATVTNVALTGTNSYETRIDSSNVRIFNSPIQFTDGSAAAPSIARRGQASIGFFFGTSKVAVANGGNEVMSWTSTIQMRVAALGDYADDAAAAAGGVAVGTCYRTGSIIKVRVA
jgi:hypothetical protein